MSTNKKKNMEDLTSEPSPVKVSEPVIEESGDPPIEFKLPKIYLPEEPYNDIFETLKLVADVFKDLSEEENKEHVWRVIEHLEKVLEVGDDNREELRKTYLRQ